MDRVGALERLAQTAQRLQARDLAALHTAQVADDARLKVRPELRGRTVAVEVATGLGVATMTATSKVDTARAAVDHHPRLLDLVGTGRVSMAGLNRVVTATAVLEAHLQERVDGLLADEATRRQMTPGQLAKAAERRVLQVDPDAAAARAAYARSTRDVRLTDPWQGMAQICATLTAAEALAIHQHLERYARGQRSAGDPRPLNTLRADLLVQTLLGSRRRLPARPPARLRKDRRRQPATAAGLALHPRARTLADQHTRHRPVQHPISTPTRRPATRAGTATQMAQPLVPMVWIAHRTHRRIHHRFRSGRRVGSGHPVRRSTSSCRS